MCVLKYSVKCLFERSKKEWMTTDCVLRKYLAFRRIQLFGVQKRDCVFWHDIYFVSLNTEIRRIEGMLAVERTTSSAQVPHTSPARQGSL